jgi:phage-related protein
MITIYESKETNFRHNGLGVLRPSSCLIYEELNGEYSLTLKHPIDNYEKWKAVTPFYKNVKQDGIVLWKVA